MAENACAIAPGRSAAQVAPAGIAVLPAPHPRPAGQLPFQPAGAATEARGIASAAPPGQPPLASAFARRTLRCPLLGM